MTGETDQNRPRLGSGKSNKQFGNTDFGNMSCATTKILNSMWITFITTQSNMDMSPGLEIGLIPVFTVM